MTRFYNHPHKDNASRSIDLAALHRDVLRCVGLSNLLRLQYVNDGHMDDHVTALFMVYLHDVEEELDRVLSPNEPDSPPF